MPDPTQAELDLAHAKIDKAGLCSCHPERGEPYCPPCITGAALLAEQREQHAEAVEAAGKKHAHLIGDNVPERMAVIAAGYLRSGWNADDIRGRKTLTEIADSNARRHAKKMKEEGHRIGCLGETCTLTCKCECHQR